jgi:hypothetical protein
VVAETQHVLAVPQSVELQVKVKALAPADPKFVVGPPEAAAGFAGQVVEIAVEHTSVPTAYVVRLPPVSSHKTTAGCKALAYDWTLAYLAFVLALLREANTTEDNIPMMAITTNNSTRVKPFL